MLPRLLLVALLMLAVPARALDKISWGWADSAPFMIPDGPDRDQGIYDRIRALVKRRLPQYEHEEVPAPIPRILKEIRAESHWCWLAAKKTPEREGFAYFSLPAVLVMPPKIIIRKDHRKAFEDIGGLSLKALLERHPERASFMRERSYSPGVDALLQQNPPGHLHSTRHVAIQLILAERIDYLLEYPVMAFYLSKRAGQEGALMALPFKEMSSHSLDRVMCPRTEWGRQVIAAVDAVLLTERPTPAYRRMLESWHDDESVQRIRQLYDSVFLSGK